MRQATDLELPEHGVSTKDVSTKLQASRQAEQALLMKSVCGFCLSWGGPPAVTVACTFPNAGENAEGRPVTGVTTAGT